MKKSEVKRIVDENIGGLKKMLGLDRWWIDVEYGKVKIQGSVNFNGQCSTVVKYTNRAKITLDPGRLEDENEVLEVLQHELVHCITSSLHLGETVMGVLVTKQQYQVLTDLFYRANEEITESFCKILNGLSPVKSDIAETCIRCHSGPRPDKPLIPLSICSKCLIAWDKKMRKQENTNEKD